MNEAGRPGTCPSEPAGRTVRLLSVGAAHGFVRRVRAGFESHTGLALWEDYGPVGVTSAKLRRGWPADVAILSRAAVEDLGREGLVLADRAADLGRVAASIAVKQGRGPLRLASEDELRTALLRAPALYVPDTRMSTVGRHLLRVLADLGIAEAVQGKLVVGDDAAATVQGLADCSMPEALGCAQSTEILAAPGLCLAAPLPGRHALDTVYSAVVVAASGQKDQARALVRHLTGPATSDLRAAAGFAAVDRTHDAPGTSPDAREISDA